MKICGIVAEFNPLHNGHQYLINQVKEKIKPDFLIVVMSGNYVQRGEISIVNKWQKTKMALKSNVDLVVELPFQSAVASVDIFSDNAVKILADLGCNEIAFGTEDSNFDYINAAEKILSFEKRSLIFDDYSQSYANQINQFYKEELGLNIRNPNQMLGLNYALAIKRNNFDININPIQRIGVAHDEKRFKNKLTSASFIRNEIVQKKAFSQFVPKEIEKIMSNSEIINHNVFEFLKYKILMSDKKQLSSIYQMSEGLENRIKSVIKDVNTIDELLEAVKTKRYTYARIRRLLLYILLNVQQSEVEESELYLRVLGFNKIGQKYLKLIRKNTQYPVITKITQDIGEKVLPLQIKVDSFIELLEKNEQNYKRQPIMEV